MEDDSLFNGAVGIDLGTTYSYYLSNALFFDLLTFLSDVSLFGKMTESKSSQTIVSCSWPSFLVSG